MTELLALLGGALLGWIAASTYLFWCQRRDRSVFIGARCGPATTSECPSGWYPLPVLAMQKQRDEKGVVHCKEIPTKVFTRYE